MGFEDFWATYPRKVGKLAALKVWQKLNPSPELVTQMLESIEQHRRCRQWREDNGKYIPHPRTFLSQGRWMDELGEHDFYRARL